MPNELKSQTIDSFDLKKMDELRKLIQINRISLRQMALDLGLVPALVYRYFDMPDIDNLNKMYDYVQNIVVKQNNENVKLISNAMLNPQTETAVL